MKIRRVKSANRRNEFQLETRSGATYTYPYAKCAPHPSAEDRIREVFVDKELGNEAFTYGLESGAEGTIHMEQVLEYNGDPKYLANLLTYKLTVEARRGMETCGLSRRQVAKRLNTSVPQLYRLLDPANMKKSMSQLVTLLHVLDCEVDLVVRKD